MDQTKRVNDYFRDLRTNRSFSGGNLAEAQVETALRALIKDIATEDMGKPSLALIGQHRVGRTGGGDDVPDFTVFDGQGAVTGFIELKRPTEDIRPAHMKPSDREQFKRYQGNPRIAQNLLYSNGERFILYQHTHTGQESTPLEHHAFVDFIAGKQRATLTDVQELHALLRHFLVFNCTGVRPVEEFAWQLAALCKHLREEVKEAFQREKHQQGRLFKLYENWNKLYMPGLQVGKFPDVYAQTLTFGYLVKQEAQTVDTFSEADEDLLSYVVQNAERQTITRPFQDALDRVRDAVQSFRHPQQDSHEDNTGVWDHFYEDFLQVYDPELRKQTGSWYTPEAVVDYQVRLCDTLLRKEFGCETGFVDPNVKVLDPAAGTGTYLARIVSHVGAQFRKHGDAYPPRWDILAENLHGFELQACPYAIANFRLRRVFTEEVELGNFVNKPKHPPHLYLADTLDDPERTPNQQELGLLGMEQEVMLQELEAAKVLKTKTNITVCLGNPPYLRHVGKQQHSWVNQNLMDEWKDRSRRLLQDRKGSGTTLIQNVNNLYVYFWRWACWKVLEQAPEQGHGIISFITANKFLDGHGFAGMREWMREHFDEIQVLDLGGDMHFNPGEPDENVFGIGIPVAIVTAFKRPAGGRKHRQARVYYRRILGKVPDKKKKLAIQTRSRSRLRGETFTPKAARVGYFAYPRHHLLFKKSYPGKLFGRTWPIGNTEDELQRRWDELKSLQGDERRRAFRNTRERDAAELELDVFNVQPYYHRPFDTCYAIADRQVTNWPSPALQALQSDAQLNLITPPITVHLKDGAAVHCSTLMMDLNSFAGRGGHVYPIYGTSEQESAHNIEQSVLEAVGCDVPSLAHYIYAVLQAPYTKKFRSELNAERGCRVPITKNQKLFKQLARLGQRLVYEHTDGQRADYKGAKLHRSKANIAVKIDYAAQQDVPKRVEHVDTKQELHLGTSGSCGVIAGVSRRVWEYRLSGYPVLSRWIQRRLPGGAGRRTSPLDDIRETHWVEEWNAPLLRLLGKLEFTVQLEPELGALLDQVVDGTCFTAEELGLPDEY